MTATAEGASAADPWRIAVIAGCILALELALIRLVPAEVRVISYFTNLILMSSFFGLGLGMIAQPLGRMPALLPLGLALIVGFIMWGRGILIYEGATSVHYWLNYEEPEGVARTLPLLPAALIAFAVCATPFVALGSQLAAEMERFPRLVAYGWDIAGSVIGAVLFLLSSLLEVPPWVWPAGIACAWSVLFVRGPALRAATVLAGGGFLLFAASAHDYRWSPYYYVQYQQEALGLRVWVNSSFHQFAADLSPKSQSAPRDFQQGVIGKFALPYQVYREHHDGKAPEKVLVLGAGTGNDVNVALGQGAGEVVAVEIDPVILSLGHALNTSAPYADPRVRTVLDDARHFLRTSTETFDLVIFGTLDSQTLLSGSSNIRLENYVYTRESFADARERLRDGGMMATYYSVFKPWLVGRLARTICPEFEGHCRVYETQDQRLFNTVIIGGRGLPGYQSVEGFEERFATSTEATDDWPFLYLPSRGIDRIYIGLIAGVGSLILLALVLVRRLHPGSGSRVHFLLLGVGFTLMEAAAIVRLALLFGSTWTVNAVVFVSVLVMIFLANVLVQRNLAPRLHVAWIGVIAAIGVNYAVDLAPLLELPEAVQVLAAATMIGVPVFFASVCFSRLFAQERTTGHALGLNLVGAMAGGLVEYLSMMVGMRTIWAVAAIVYLLAFVTSRRALATGDAAPVSAT